MYACERELEESALRHFSDSAWVVSITLALVGYGTIAPMTVCGRGVAMFTAGTGVLVVALMTTAIHQKVYLLTHESRMVMFLGRSNARRELLDSATRTIQRKWLARKARIKANKAKGKNKVHPMFLLNPPVGQSPRNLTLLEKYREWRSTNALYKFSKSKLKFESAKFSSNEDMRSRLEGVQRTVELVAEEREEYFIKLKNVCFPVLSSILDTAGLPCNQRARRVRELFLSFSFFNSFCGQWVLGYLNRLFILSLK